jgi:hypothetical protein
MSYSAFVNCNCSKNGKTSCEHEDNRLASEYLTNYVGMMHFRYAIELFNGENNYPILAKYLPTSNDGFLSVEYSQRFLDELLILETETRKYEATMLNEEKTNELIAKAIAFNLEQFVYTEYNTNIYTVSRHGFHIYAKLEKDSEDKYIVVFRSKYFFQRKISDGVYEFTDKKNNEMHHRSSVKLYPFEGAVVKDYAFKTTTKLVKIQDEYGDIIESLKKLARLSIESGNPICWE